MNKQINLFQDKQESKHNQSHLNPIHLFGLKRKQEGIYFLTYTTGHLIEELSTRGIKPNSGDNLHEIFSKELMAKWTPFLEKTFAGEMQVVDSYRYDQYIRTTICPVLNKEGMIEEVAGTTFEIPESNEKNIERLNTMKKFKHLFNHALEAIVICNSDLEIIELNEATCQMLKLPKHELLYKNAKDFLTEEEKELVEIRSQFISEGKIKGEFHYKMQEGYMKEIEFTCDKEIISNGYVMVLEDITDKKVTEQKLLQAEALNVVGELAAGVAHEIRNPLTSLKGFVQLIQNQTSSYDQYLSIILSEVDRIEHIIKEFLVLSKSNSQNYSYQCVKDIIQDTVELLNTQAIMKNIEIKTHIEHQLPNMYCDGLQLKQVFINFIKNAIEASSPGGNIEINLSYELYKREVQIKISDNGCGMDKETLEKIGKPFFTTKEEGTGLGLMVSHNIIKHHDGKLDVKSEKGKGTVFLISLPVKLEMNNIKKAD